MGNYYEIKNEISSFSHPEVFYAFGDDSFKEQSKQMPKGEKIVRGFIGGMFGTRRGLTAMADAMIANNEKIRNECTPQEVYDYEYANYECGYTGDDSDSLDHVQFYWPDAKIVRKRGY